MRDESFAPLEEALRRVDLERPHFSYVERRRVTDAGWAQLVDAALVRRIEDAEWADCTACGEVEDVSFLPNAPEPYPYIWCREAGLLRVEPERLRQWTVDVARLAEALAAALSCAGRVEELVPGRVWLLGRTAVGGRSREVFLGRQLARHDGAAVVGGCRRLLAGVAPVVLVAGVIPEPGVWSGDAPPVVALPSLVTLEARGLTADRAYLESALAAHLPPKVATAAASFPTPHGATWEDVRLVVGEHELDVTVRGKSVRYGFAEAGFEDRRKGGVPDHLWRLLRLFALRGGVVPFDAQDMERKDRDNLKNLVSQLRRRLCALLQVPDDPFRPTRASRRYETRFTISTTSTVLLPVPAGAAWEDVAIEEVAPDRIRFTIDAAVRASVRAGARDEDEGTSWEATERDGEVSREYDVVTLGLADREGDLTAEGLVLRAVLRGRGVIARPATDKAILALGARLSRMAQIPAPASPFEFAPAGSRWTARFAASSSFSPSAQCRLPSRCPDR